jgi:acyl-CoA reductase-like NAD-dependent aldehyde dehydrogenase
MSQHFDLMVPGAQDGGRRITVSAPWDGRKIATVSAIDALGVDRALETAYRIFRDKDAWLSPAQRVEILTRSAGLMTERAETLALEAAREGGKPLVDSRVEVARAIDGIRSCVECLRTEAGREIPMGLNAASLQHLAMTHREPIGVVVAFSAFNHPLNLVVHQAGPAIAAGCPVIVKPAETTPLSTLRFVGLLREAGLPQAYCQALVVDDLDLAGTLAGDERVGFLSFIGSARVGWMLRSRLAPGARCALEHGGVAPVILAPDADLDDALPLIAKGGFYHAGQVCVSVQRVFAHRTVATQVAERLAALGEAMVIGDPTRPETRVGPLIRPEAVERVALWVEEAIAQGAQRVCGATRLSPTTYACTVLLDPPPQARVSTQEIFGPVICVYAYDDLDEALGRANALAFAFQAAVFTRDIDTALRCYRRLDAAAVMVNDHTAFRVDWMPFAGLRRSGLGVGGIPYTFREMQIEKLMVLRSGAL